ncbi:MAG: hypothetical protein IPJ88_13045 [Myxococcales bacterium]|nr:MAG: hypothetical protein IPJ88_13045 [Myxococcales bacterium]
MTHGFRKAKVAIVSSVGGHLTDVLSVLPAFSDVERLWILQDESPLLPDSERAFVVAHAERDLRVLYNFFEFLVLFSREKPDVVVSPGAGIAVPAAVIARLFGIPVIYLECSCSVVQLSLTGRIMRFLTSRFFVQWRGLASKTKGARYIGGVF